MNFFAVLFNYNTAQWQEPAVDVQFQLLSDFPSRYSSQSRISTVRLV